MPSEKDNTDILIIGTGLAGLYTALKIANHAKVTLLSKSPFGQGSSLYAQGGVAAVYSKEDSLEEHFQDTMRAGGQLSKASAVKHILSHSRQAVLDLVDLGVPFTRDESGEIHLTQEGGHSQRRILHVADHTGRAIMQTLMPLVKQHPNIQIIEHQVALELIVQNGRCVGSYAINNQTQQISTYLAKSVVLATGGASKVYMYTTNPDTATGDGIAMAWRAGCRVANMEFTQFHPTALFHRDAKAFLISEALRGEGAVLRLPSGETFMEKYDERGELAPRDVVARAIDSEMKRVGAEFVHLDISHKPADFIKSHFPMIYEKCLSLGIDITRQPIPVVPAAHYSCGGIVTDLNGLTDLDNLYAVGETAYTGLHGANRLASNSLLECLVMAQSVAQDFLKKLYKIAPPGPVAQWDTSLVCAAREYIMIYHDWDELRKLMSDYVGIVRRDLRLVRAKRRLQVLKTEIQEFYSLNYITSDFVELRNLVQVAELIIESASRRKNSVGLHYNMDHPNLPKTLKNTVLTPRKGKHHVLRPTH